MKIKDYAKFIAKNINYEVNFKYDKFKKDGTPRKILNTSLAKKYGWKAKTSLEIGFKKTYKNFLTRFA